MADYAFLIAVAKSVGSNLASYAQQQKLLAWGLDTQVQKLRKTMETINAFLRDVEEREGVITTSHSDQLWVSNLCNALYDADDVLDEIMTTAERKKLMEGNAFFKEVKLSFSSSNPLISSFSFAQKIKSIRQNLDGIANDRKSFACGCRHLGVGKQVESNYLSNNVVGRENEKDELMSMLLDSNFEDNVCVIPIIGVGGIGKSTLARYVFDDEKVKANFKDLRLWVPLLQGMTLKDVIGKIVATLSHGRPKSRDSNELNNVLSEIFTGKKYILVLDNVWNKSIADWRDLKSLLTSGAIHGSRILLTTHSPIIAKNTRSVKSMKLEPLGNDHSWSLFERIVFEKIGCHDPNLKEIGLKNLPMCYNVPLAIQALANVLATDLRVSFWSMFHSDTVSNLAKHGKNHDIMSILKHNYNYLRPSALKSCFSYCSLFPKGHEFDKNKLVILWIAQGFVEPLHEKSHLSLEEEGSKYLDMLVNKGLFQDIPNDESDISSCKLHDLMYELSSSVSVNKCKILNVNEDLDIETNLHHVSINYKVDTSFKITHLQSFKQLRTFILTKGSYDDQSWLSPSLCKKLMQSFLCLRTLDLHALGIVEISKDIGNLIHLRYLDLSKNCFKKLPNSITSLYNLQYLNLIDTDVTELPKDMYKLVNLTHLLVGRGITYFPFRRGKLRHLQTSNIYSVGLSETLRFRLDSCGRLSDLKSLNFLRGELTIYIGFYKNIGSDAKEANLKGKKNIKCLTLDWKIDRPYVNDEDVLVLEYLQPHNQISELCIKNYKGNKMPTWMSTAQITYSLQNLTCITIVYCYYITHLPSFSRLPSLKSLKLAILRLEYIESSVDEYESTSSSTLSSSSNVFFPSLTNIDINFISSLKGWREHGEGNLFFPCVSDVSIRDCWTLESLPSCPNVKKLSLMKVPHLRMSIRRGASPSSSASWVPKLVSLEVDNVKNVAFLAGEYCLRNLSELKLHWGDHTEGSSDAAWNNVMVEKAFESMISLKSLQVSGDRVDGVDRSMKVLPRGIGHLNMLQSLELYECEELEEIPVWIGNLCSLSTLRMIGCPKLTSLPEEMTKLTQLKLLEVSHYCNDQLIGRMKKNVGEDWHKIQHIQKIRIV